jgi:hypothetical protein
MKPLSATELLSVWERAASQPVTARALLLLAAAMPGTTVEELARLSIGRRDAALLTLREWLFGSHLVSLAPCPQCTHQMELTFETAEIRATGIDVQPEHLVASAGGYEAQFRLPDSDDLAAIAAEAGHQPEATMARELLLSRCLLQVRRRGRRQTVDRVSELPSTLVAAIAGEMERADPQANVQLDLTCTDCGHRWLATFDITSYLWGEIENWASRILREVHWLASAYSWHEADILALSAERRRLYLELIGRAF